MGVSLYPSDGLDSEILVKNADKAMYYAKDQGRNNFRFFTTEMDREEKMLTALGASLQDALDKNEFRLQYQPLVDIRSGQIIAVEAFLRWQHPQLGSVPPATIFLLAEEAGLIGKIGNWVLQTGVEQNSTWQSLTGSNIPVKISLNIATFQYQRGDIIDTISKVLKSCELPPELLELELTEDYLINDPEDSARTLSGLSNLGVGLTIDDFGSGYSSLGFLERFPLKTIKIDGYLIANMVNDANTAAIVLTFITFAHTLGIKVVAEGVETEEQLHLLRTDGCDWVQGYYFSRPVEAEEMTKMLQEDRQLVINENWPVG
jgi:EAL domain-containing protein (putative c-di-GMP-specific phosphodiesterase class I)